MPITCDWHIHSHHSPECKAHPDNAMAKLLAAIEACGITHYGITDHLHGTMNVAQLEASRREFDSLPDSPSRYFAVEVSCLREWDVQQTAAAEPEQRSRWFWPGGPENRLTLPLLDEELIERLGISYVIGGAHCPLGVPEPYDDEDAVIRSYHRQNMFIATHPLADIVAHPWWWGLGYLSKDDPRYHTFAWTGDFNCIPLSMHDEFAAAAVEHGTAVEINASASLVNPNYPDTFRSQYRDYLAYLKERGVQFSLGSDSHSWVDEDDVYTPHTQYLEEDLQWLGIGTDELWMPAGEPHSAKPD